MDSVKSCRPGFIIGLASAALLGLLTALAFPGVNMRAIETKLETAVRAALSATDFANVNVAMRGQRAILTGSVANEALKKEASALALKAAGGGGNYAGGVTNVDVSALQIAAVQGPRPTYSWGARRSANGVQLLGAAPDDATRQALVARARTLFRGEVSDQMTIVAGAPGADWAAIANGALEQLAKLKRGSVRLNDTTLSVVGEGDQAGKQLVEAYYAQALPAPYQAKLDLLVEGQGLQVQGIEGMNLSDATSDTCQTAFTRLTGGRTINFTSGSADIDAGSNAFLEDIGRVARRCDQYKIKVVGHTDDEGEAAFNRALSERRAGAVRDRLLQLGVAGEQLSAIGMGEDSPLDARKTAAARAKNRRIEFQVTM
jgi:OOP family OmpA-OmpF porin